jgi:hypothetical protein
LAVTVARDTIVCPTCSGQRIVTSRQARESRQRGGIPCSSCRGLGKTIKTRDEDFDFWLNRFGVQAPTGVTAREFITAGGAPRDLVQLARECYPDVL